MKLVIAPTGASGTIYLQRLLAQIDCAANEVHLVMSGHAKQVAVQEVDQLVVPSGVSEHAENDLNVPFVSGSARFDAMVIVPCSMATLGRVASGCSDTALLRAADVFLKERRKLILVPRETPWSLIHARNVVTLLEAGAILLPAVPSKMLPIPSSGAFSIKSDCRILARIAGETRVQKPGVRQIENRRMASAAPNRFRIPPDSTLGAHIALRAGGPRRRSAG